MRERIASIDLLRGLIMSIMVLDHCRDYFSFTAFNPLDTHHSTVMYFITRWITNLCAPTFVFLAGISAYLYGQKRNKKSLMLYLLSRGVFLVLLEVIVISSLWQTYVHQVFILQVIWVMGLSMILLSMFLWLPRTLLWGGVILFFSHNVLDAVLPSSLGNWAWFGYFLHVPHYFKNVIGNQSVLLGYPLIPWPGLMLFGYLVGPLFEKNQVRRRQSFVWMGAGLLTIFVILRLFNGFGDPVSWHVHNHLIWTLFSFINTEKYPPSLLFICMTLGISCFILAFFEIERKTRLRAILLNYGQVPLFFYVLHLCIVASAGNIMSLLQYHGSTISWFIHPETMPQDINMPLWHAYAAWLVTLLLLSAPCRWYCQYKKVHDYRFLSYL